MGPFPTNSEVYFPLGIHDIEGHKFSLSIDTDDFDGYDPAALADGVLNFVSPDPGIYEFRLHAVESDDGGETGWGAENYKDYTIVIGQNAPPSVHYGPTGFALLNEPYQFDIHVADPNPEDTLTVSIRNQEALFAGMEIVEPVGNSQAHSLRWSPTNMLNWIGDHSLPLDIPVVIDVSDDQGNVQQIAFNLPVYDPSHVASPSLNKYDYQILAGREWQLPFLVDNPGGHELTYAIAVNDGGGAPGTDPLPSGLTMSSDSLMSWNPPLSLLVDQHGNANQSAVFDLVVTVSNLDGSGGYTDEPLKITVVDPSYYTNQYVPKIDRAVEPPVAATVGERFVFQPTLTNEAAEHPVTWHLDVAPKGMIIDDTTGTILVDSAGLAIGRAIRSANGGPVLDLRIISHIFCRRKRLQSAADL